MHQRIRSPFVEPDRTGKGQQLGCCCFTRAAPCKITRQGNGAESDPNEATDHQTDGLDHPAHLAVAPLLEGHRIPAVDAISTRLFQLVESRRPILEVDALDQAHALFGIEFAQHPHGVLALHLVTWMHQARSQVAPSGEQQESARVVVQSPDRNPAARGRPRQIGKDTWTPFGIVMRDDFARWLVIEQYRVLDRTGTQTDRRTIDLDLIGSTRTVSKLGEGTIHGHPPRRNEVIDLTARSTSMGGQQFLNANRLSGHDFHGFRAQRTARATHRARLASPPRTTGARRGRRELGRNPLASRFFATPTRTPGRLALTRAPGLGGPGPGRTRPLDRLESRILVGAITSRRFDGRALVARPALLQRARR